MSETITACPTCGSDRVVPIHYGLPGADAMWDELAGKLVIGGCQISAENPSWACRTCDARW